MIVTVVNLDNVQFFPLLANRLVEEQVEFHSTVIFFGWLQPSSIHLQTGSRSCLVLSYTPEQACYYLQPLTFDFLYLGKIPLPYPRLAPEKVKEESVTVVWLSSVSGESRPTQALPMMYAWTAVFRCPYFTWLFIFVTTLYFYSLHFETNICTFCFLHFKTGP